MHQHEINYDIQNPQSSYETHAIMGLIAMYEYLYCIL